MSGIRGFREQLRSGRVALGSSITFTDPLVTDALGDSADFFWIDMEHSPMSPEALNGHLLAARHRGTPALVRVPGVGAQFTKAALDGGADGVIVPQVRTPEEAAQVVSDCRYPPVGTRGFGPRVPSNYGREGGSGFIRQANEDVFVAIQIETAEAVEAIDDIVSVRGLDSIVIGPNDLSGALGMLGEVEHPKVVAAMERIIAKSKSAGLFVGAGLGADPDYACVLAKRGVQWMHVGCDWHYLVCHMDQLVSAVRKRLKS